MEPSDVRRESSRMLRRQPTLVFEIACLTRTGGSVVGNLKTRFTAYYLRIISKRRGIAEDDNGDMVKSCQDLLL